MEDTIKIELLTPLTGTFIPNEMEQDWEEEDYNDFEEEQVFLEGDDLTEYPMIIGKKNTVPQNPGYMATPIWSVQNMKKTGRCGQAMPSAKDLTSAR